jgi:hypothetical protein
MFSEHTFCDLLTKKYVSKTYFLSSFDQKVCFENILSVVSIAIKYAIVTSLCVFKCTTCHPLLVYCLCLCRPHILGMSLARFDSVLSANRLPVPLASTRFGPLLNPLVHTLPDAQGLPSSEPVLARRALLSKCQSGKRSLANKIQDADASRQKELEPIRSLLPLYLNTKKCKCPLYKLAPTKIRTSRHSTRYYASGSQAGKRKCPADHSSWLFNELTRCSSFPAGAKYCKCVHLTFLGYSYVVPAFGMSMISAHPNSIKLVLLLKLQLSPKVLMLFLRSRYSR